ncbi:MAG: hypothetical protein ABI891_12860, partial [Acidobacteriota bacterium]
MISGVRLSNFTKNAIFKNNTVWNTDQTGKNLVITNKTGGFMPTSFTNSGSIAIPAATSSVNG